MKKQYSRFPPVQYRLREEDLVRERTETQKAVTEGGEDIWQMEDYQKNVELRQMQHQTNNAFEDDRDEDNDDEDNEENARQVFTLN